MPDRLGRPSRLFTVDASTIRAASIEPEEGQEYITNDDFTETEAKWVQVYNGQVVSTFTGKELAFAVRNPRTDMNIQPYGFSELEVLVHQVTAHLWAEEYNTKYFSQGGTTKGILNLKSQNLSKEQLDAFRRQWTAQLSGVTGAWKTPVVSVDGLEYINVSQSNREMEYEMWMNYLINICCAVYQIDPAEINFPNRGGSGGGSGGGLGDGGIEDRLKNSKDKGLRPVLRFVESVINKNIIRRFSSEFSFNFVGLDKESEKEKLEVLDKSVRTHRTINEIRKEKDLPPLENGDIILDQTYTNYIMQKQQQQEMAQQAPEGQEAPDNPEEAQQQQQDQEISNSIDDQYGDNDNTQ
ncbi:Phage portal protein [compost metagenome]